MNDELLEELVVRINRFAWGHPNITVEFVYEELTPWMNLKGLELKDYYKALHELINRGWLIVFPYSAENIQYRKPNGL